MDVQFENDEAGSSLPVMSPVDSIVHSLMPYIDFVLSSGYDREHIVFWAIGIFVLLLVLCTILGKCLSEQDRVSKSRELAVRIKDLGMPNFPIVQNEPIFYNGIVSVVGSAMDDEFEIVTMD